MFDLITYNSSSSVINTTSKRGTQTTRLMRAKEFKSWYRANHINSNNREVKLAFLKYYSDGCKLNCADLAAALTTGKLGIEAKRLNKDGDKMNVTFIDLSGPQDIEIVKDSMENMAEEDLKNVLEYIKSRLAPAQDEQAIPEHNEDFVNSPE